ncbi:hypothetical protein SAY86_007400 [Trapa natans]|uniref:Arf-GAP domain-containing protein n=1 Tax=Trapa natans TaxID=22666 RepID=A0AAN7LBL4_TRANT|nr:hypothetical protein SAY86_007400 [Trapa natans]
MANKKEDEKNEKIIRGLLKLPENRRCINCNSLGPQYVCTSFWTFVCTTCSGIHREFTHRVKSVSMAKFTSQEVSSLQGGGNQKAKEFFLKEWDAQRSLPDSSNVERLRDFIKHVYVDRRFSGDKGSERPPRGKMGDREDSYQGGSQSPPYDDAYDRRQSDRSGSDGRSPGYDQQRQQYNNYKSPGRPEVVNDWRREDRFRDGKKFDDHKVPDRESKVGGSPERPKDPDSSSPPVARAGREILVKNLPPPRIEPPKPIASHADGLAQAQRTTSSSSLEPTTGKQMDVKLESSASLIDFNADPEPLAAVHVQAQPATQGIPQPSHSTTDNNWASFDIVPDVNVSQPPVSMNSLDILSQLSVPASAPSHISGRVAPSSGPSVLPIVSASNPVTLGDTPMVQFTHGVVSAMPSNAASAIVPGPNSMLAPNSGISYSMQPQQPSLFPVSGVHSTHHSTVPVSGAHSQTWNISAAPRPQGFFTSVPSQASFSNQPDMTVGALSENPSLETKSSARKELPADFFTAMYSPLPAHHPMWQGGSPYGYAYRMPYNPVMIPLQPQPVPSYPPAAKSVNPFDVNESSPAQVPRFPSLTPLQGALPNIPPSSMLLHASAAVTPSAAWTPAQSSSFTQAVPHQTLTYASALPSGAYMGQQMTGTMPPLRPQGLNYANQPLPGSSSSPYGPTNPSISARRNPFG